VQSLDSFPTFYGTRKFIIAFTRALYFASILCQTNPVHPTPSFFFTKSILMLSTQLRLGLPGGLFPSYFPTNNLYAVLPNLHYMLRPSHPPELNNYNYTWRRVLIMKLLIMQSSPPSRHFIPLWSKYIHRYSLLKYP
jgi:hypothetical protein